MEDAYKHTHHVVTSATLQRFNHKTSTEENQIMHFYSSKSVVYTCVFQEI